MRQLIVGSITAAVIVVSVSTIACAAPLSPQHSLSGLHVHRVNYYYWNHHRYAHRDWDRYHHHWHYY
jgi:hypothetical protein